MSNIIIYSTNDGKSKLEVTLDGENLWLTQKQIGELYDKSKSTISEHISHIFTEEELEKSAVVRKFRTTANDGKNYDVEYYNLEMIMAIGFRVRSKVGTQFRRWANETLQEYITKGFVMDDDRLKNPPVANSTVPDRFDEMLERIRDIRASERRMYLRVREIFALASDYNPTWKETTLFFQKIQNKLHFAVTHLTAAELIAQRAKHNIPNMGLKSWRGDEIRLADVTVAKNYLKESEIDELNRIVSMWLDFAEDQAKRKKQIFLNDWKDRLDSFLIFNERDVLSNAGKISKKEADKKAKDVYEKFRILEREAKEKMGEQANIEALENILKSHKP